MLPQKRRPSHIVALSILYSVLFIAIILSFPKKGGESSEDLSFFSAPRATKTASNLPVQISRGTTTKTAPIAAPSTKVSSPAQVTNTTVKYTPQVQTCASIGICDKIRFSDGYTTKQKADYYKEILNIVGSISSNLPKPGILQDTLYSLTLSNEDGERRGRGGSQTILIYTKDIETLQEFREILTHELGHIIDLGVVKGTSSRLDTSFQLGGKSTFSLDDPSLNFYRFSRSDTQTRFSTAAYTDFVGGYGMTSPYEDFAESFNLFLWHHDIFVAMTKSSEILQKKFGYINNLMNGFYFESDSEGLSRFIQNPKQRPWDSTRMSLE